MFYVPGPGPMPSVFRRKEKLVLRDLTVCSEHFSSTDRAPRPTLGAGRTRTDQVMLGSGLCKRLERVSDKLAWEVTLTSDLERGRGKRWDLESNETKF